MHRMGKGSAYVYCTPMSWECVPLSVCFALAPLDQTANHPSLESLANKTPPAITTGGVCRALPSGDGDRDLGRGSPLQGAWRRSRSRWSRMYVIPTKSTKCVRPRAGGRRLGLRLTCLSRDAIPARQARMVPISRAGPPPDSQSHIPPPSRSLCCSPAR
jgi:hypothetical protein